MSGLKAPLGVWGHFIFINIKIQTTTKVFRFCFRLLFRQQHKLLLNNVFLNQVFFHI